MNKWLIVICFFLFISVGIMIGRFWGRLLYNRKIQRLNLILDTIMRGELSPDWSPYQEGEISLLVNQLELLVKRTNHMVNQLNSEKTVIHDFIADISHQIKTPLTGLITYLDLLESTEKDDSKKAQISACIYLAERMNDLVRTLLELTKLDSGVVKLHIETVAAMELIQSAEQSAMSARPNTKSSFLTDIEERITIRCDCKWFHQALVNVLVNALDYSPDHSPIKITVKQNDGITVIKVLDQNGGMDEKDLQNIFKRFYRPPNSKNGGFGIGLSITESIIKLHKGNIRAVNEGDGLAMILTLPLLPCAENYENYNLTTS